MSTVGMKSESFAAIIIFVFLMPPLWSSLWHEHPWLTVAWLLCWLGVFIGYIAHVRRGRRTLS